MCSYFIQLISHTIEIWFHIYEIPKPPFLPSMLKVKLDQREDMHCYGWLQSEKTPEKTGKLLNIFQSERHWFYEKQILPSNCIYYPAIPLRNIDINVYPFHEKGLHNTCHKKHYIDKPFNVFWKSNPDGRKISPVK